MRRDEVSEGLATRERRLPGGVAAVEWDQVVSGGTGTVSGSCETILRNRSCTRAHSAWGETEPRNGASWTVGAYCPLTPSSTSYSFCSRELASAPHGMSD